jgi:hypothetical protein
MVVTMTTCIKGGQRWRSGATFGCSGGGGGRGGEGRGGEGCGSERKYYGMPFYFFSFASIVLVLCSNTAHRVICIYLVLHRVVFFQIRVYYCRNVTMKTLTA